MQSACCDYIQNETLSLQSLYKVKITLPELFSRNKRVDLFHTEHIWQVSYIAMFKEHHKINNVLIRVI